MNNRKWQFTGQLDKSFTIAKFFTRKLSIGKRWIRRVAFECPNMIWKSKTSWVLTLCRILQFHNGDLKGCTCGKVCELCDRYHHKKHELLTYVIVNKVKTLSTRVNFPKSYEYSMNIACFTTFWDFTSRERPIFASSPTSPKIALFTIRLTIIQGLWTIADVCI